ncbi:MAG: hypothetical protein QM691_10295 [Opitutaceae bacterium]
MRSAIIDRHLHGLLVALFCTAAAVHFHFATLNWHHRFMAGHEFRQTQTALIAHYIDKENNFSLDYSVPLLGKPWVLPLEFPLYEWAVVALARVTGLPQFEAARAISLSSFYLTLPAAFLLLGQLGLDRARRLFVLACALLCPVYIFYARAVLIDPLALLCSVWFLAAFTRLLAPGTEGAEPSRLQHLGWLLLVIVAGTAAGLIKSLVWFVWVLPAFAFGLCRFVRAFRSAGLPAALRTCAWGLGAMAIPVTAAVWWARYTDAIKAVHPSAYIFTSSNLARGNYGTFSLAAHLSPTTWRNLLACWQQSLLPPWVFALFIVTGLLLLPRWRRRLAAATALFLAAQLSIPLAYAYQDYYFYAANLFAVAAVAFVFLGLLDSRLPRLLSAPLLLLPLAALFATYRADYFQFQAVRSSGGSGLTESLKTCTPPHGVLVIAGADWSPIIPYYAERKALMLRRGLENHAAYLERAFADLADEEVAALVLCGDQRGNHALIERAAAAFNLDPNPTYSHPDGDVFIGNLHREFVLRHLHGNHGHNGVTTQAVPAPATTPDSPFLALPPVSARPAFAGLCSPLPSHCRFSYGFNIWPIDGVRHLSLHADSDLIVPAPAAATRIHWEYCILRDAYERADGGTNGVEFIIDGETPDGTGRRLYRRLLDPVATPADRGIQILDLPFTPRPGERLIFRTRDNGSPSFDWAASRQILVH